MCCTCRNGEHHVRSRCARMVGLIPLFAVETIEPALLEQLPDVQAAAGMVPARTAPSWPPGLALAASRARASGGCWRSCRGHRMKRLLKRMLDETEFLSPYGVRALSRYPRRASLRARRRRARATRVDYEPAESEQRPVRRQLQLARPDLVPGQLPAHRVAPAVPPLLRRRFQGRMPHRLGPAS